MTGRISRIVATTFLTAAPLFAADYAIVDGSGRTVGMVHEGEELAIRTSLYLPTPGWQTTYTQPTADRVTVTRSDSVTTYQGSIDMDSTRRLLFTQTVRQDGAATVITLNYSASGTLTAEGLFFRLDVPWADFKGGFAEYPGTNRSTLLPEVRPPNVNLMGATTSRIAVRDAASNWQLAAILDRPYFVNLQDKSNEGPQNFTFWIYVVSGSLASGATGQFRIELMLTGVPDTTPATVTLDPTAGRYLFHGFGGNYCFQIESPVTQYTLDNLQVRWARTEMTLAEWEPVNDNSSPSVADWTFFQQRDLAGTNLRREFELAREIQRRGIPYVISIWNLPEWLYVDPRPQPSNTSQRRVNPDLWDELLESIGSYLLYAKNQYGVEPDLFSFNEPNLGINVLFSPEEHRDAIKSIGAHLASLGLKTKMLLGDVNHPRGTHTYVQPAAADPEAMRYAGAVSFHSWGGATPEQYRAWGDLAESLGLPLLVAEMGADPAAWRGRVYDNFWYGLREVQQYQELLLYARPQATIYWEFTADYSLVRTLSAAGATVLEPTSRFWFTKQLADLTPPQSTALGVESDKPKVLATAFLRDEVLTLHIANLGAAREVTVFGIPSQLALLRRIRTSEAESFAEYPPLPAWANSVRLTLPERSLTTLTSRFETPSFYLRRTRGFAPPSPWPPSPPTR